MEFRMYTFLMRGEDYEKVFKVDLSKFYFNSYTYGY